MVRSWTGNSHFDYKNFFSKYVFRGIFCRVKIRHIYGEIICKSIAKINPCFRPYSKLHNHMWNFVYFVSSFEYPLFSGLKGWWYFLNGVAIYISLQYTRYHSLKFENWFSYFLYWYSAQCWVKQWTLIMTIYNAECLKYSTEER